MKIGIEIKRASDPQNHKPSDPPLTLPVREEVIRWGLFLTNLSFP